MGSFNKYCVKTSQQKINVLWSGAAVKRSWHFTARSESHFHNFRSEKVGLIFPICLSSPISLKRMMLWRSLLVGGFPGPSLDCWQSYSSTSSGKIEFGLKILHLMRHGILIVCVEICTMHEKLLGDIVFSILMLPSFQFSEEKNP